VSASTTMGPLSLPRRHSPSIPASVPRVGRQYDDSLSSNASPSAAVSGAGGDSRPHSQPPTPPSRSSTAHAATVAVKPHDNGYSSAGHSPPAASGAGSSARDQG